jgi:ABC-2 type transport system permease protein
MYIGGLIKKEFGRIKSDKRTLILLFVIPLVLIVIFGLTTGGGPTKFFTASIISRDDMPSQRTYDNKTFFYANTSIYDESFISIVQNNCSSFGFHSYYNSTSESEFEMQKALCIELLRSEAIDAFIVLPENFSESVNRSVNIHLIYYIDGSDLGAVSAIGVAIQEPIALFRLQNDRMGNFTTLVPYMEYSVPSWESQMLNFSLGMMLPLIIIGTTMNLTSLSIVSEGPLPRMMLTPTAKTEIILSKLIANSVIMLLQATEIFVMTSFFGLYSLGALFDFYVILVLTGLCGVCIGLFISALATTETVANQMFLMFFIVLLVFSGLFFDSDSPILALITAMFPLGYASPMMTSVTLKGKPLDLISVLSLSLICLVFVLMAYIVYRFKKVEV